MQLVWTNPLTYIHHTLVGTWKYTSVHYDTTFNCDLNNQRIQLNLHISDHLSFRKTDATQVYWTEYNWNAKQKSHRPFSASLLGLDGSEVWAVTCRLYKQPDVLRQRHTTDMKHLVMLHYPNSLTHFHIMSLLKAFCHWNLCTFVIVYHQKT